MSEVEQERRYAVVTQTRVDAEYGYGGWTGNDNEYTEVEALLGQRDDENDDQFDERVATYVKAHQEASDKEIKKDQGATKYTTWNYEIMYVED